MSSVFPGFLGRALSLLFPTIPIYFYLQKATAFQWRVGCGLRMFLAKSSDRGIVWSECLNFISVRWFFGCVCDDGSFEDCRQDKVSDAWRVP